MKSQAGIWKNLTKFANMMKRTALIPFLLKTLLAIYLVQSLVACANIVPPSGGPRDSIPPYRVWAKPKDSALNEQPKEILVTFNEYITTTNLQENVVVSPTLKTNPLIESNLKTIRIRIKDSLTPNTTYSIQFGNSIKDVNEGNVAPNYTYVFSTGNYIDSGRIQGKVLLAESGKVDSTLIVVLQPIKNDTAIFKNKPLYYAKLNGKGNFGFDFLPFTQFNVFVLPNDYTKKYDDSTKLFAFLNEPVMVSRSKDSIQLYAFQSHLKTEKKKTNNNKQQKNNAAILKYTKSLEGKEQDLLTTLQLTFETPVHLNDSFPIVLADTLDKPLKDFTVKVDSANANKIIIQYNWVPSTKFHLILPQNAIKDTNNNFLIKSDTIAFVTKSKTVYGSCVVRVSKLDQFTNPVLLLTQDDKLKFSFPLTQSYFTIKQLPPGEYQIKILEDKNKNGKWDTGQYGFGKGKVQPEIIWMQSSKLIIRADWENELNFSINK
jgi:hypothetical protein